MLVAIYKRHFCKLFLKLFYYLTQNFRTCGKLNYQMKLKENISINEFDGKHYQLSILEPNNNDKAVLTHYLHNKHNGVSKHYKKDAIKVLNNFVEYKQVEEQIILLQKMLCNNFFLKLKTFLFQHHKITLLNLLTFLQELADFV